MKFIGIKIDVLNFTQKTTNASKSKSKVFQQIFERKIKIEKIHWSEATTSTGFVV